MKKVNDMNNKIVLAGERLHSLGFENEQEYRLYLRMKESLKQAVPVGIAS